jgi:hypothetical protein
MRGWFLDIGCRNRPVRNDVSVRGAYSRTPEQGVDDVKYVVLIYSNPATWEALPPEEAERVIKDHFVVIDELTRSGELLSRFGLSDPTNTKTVRIHDGIPAVTDGPFGEAKEHLAGVFVVDVENIDRVIEFTGPLAQHGVVEVRPIMEEAGTEM